MNPWNIEIERGRDRADTVRIVEKWLRVKSAGVSVYVLPRCNRVFLVREHVRSRAVLPSGLLPAVVYLSMQRDLPPQRE